MHSLCLRRGQPCSVISARLHMSRFVCVVTKSLTAGHKGNTPHQSEDYRKMRKTADKAKQRPLGGVKCSRGEIMSIDGTHARIRIARSSACDTCEAGSRCMRHAHVLMVDVDDEAVARHRVGDNVRVAMSERTGRHAVMLGFGLPLLLAVAVMALSSRSGAGDTVSAAASLAVLTVYYMLLVAARRWLNRHFAVTLYPDDDGHDGVVNTTREQAGDMETHPAQAQDY